MLATDDVCLYQAIENIRDFLGKLETHGSGDADIRRQEGQNRVAVEAKVEIVHGGVFVCGICTYNIGLKAFLCRRLYCSEEQISGSRRCRSICG